MSLTGVDVTLLPVTLLIAKSCLFHCLQQAAGPGDRDCTCAFERRRARMCSYHLSCSLIGLQGSRKPPKGCQLGDNSPSGPHLWDEGWWLPGLQELEGSQEGSSLFPFSCSHLFWSSCHGRGDVWSWSPDIWPAPLKTQSSVGVSAL